MRAETDPLPLTVIGGYLGAGKTTLVNRILAAPDGRRYGVIVNDVGEVNIDAALIEAVDGDTVTLTNGCVCCSLADGFAAALAELRAPARAIDHVVVEVSGVGDPRTVAQWGRTPGFHLDAVVVLADAETVRERAQDRYVGETVVAQLAGADLVLLTHLDTIDDPDTTVAELEAWIGGLTHAPVLHGRHWGQVLLSTAEREGRGPGSRSPNAASRSPGNATASRHAGSGDGDAGSGPVHAQHHVAIIDAAPGRTRSDWERWLRSAPEGVVRVKGFAEVVADGHRELEAGRSATARDVPDHELASVQLAGRRAEVLRWKGGTDVPRRLVVIATHTSPDLDVWLA